MKNSSKIIFAILAIAAIALLASYLVAHIGSGKSEPASQESAEIADNQDADDQEYVMPEEEMVLEDDPTTKDYDNGIYFDEETEGANIETKKAPESDFIGKWKATSGQAAYYYGNVELTIETNGTWTGNITEEPLKGKWRKQGDGIYLTSELFNCTLTFSSEGTLMMQEDYQDSEESDEEAVIVVLTRK